MDDENNGVIILKCCNALADPKSTNSLSIPITLKKNNGEAQIFYLKAFIILFMYLG